VRLTGDLKYAAAGRVCTELAGAGDLVQCTAIVFEHALARGASWVALWENEGDAYRLVGARGENDDLAGPPAVPGRFPDGTLELKLRRSAEEVGILGLGPPQNGSDWPPEDRDLWGIVAAQLALAWHGIRLEYTLQSTRRELGKRELDLGTLFGIAQELNSSLSSRTISQTLLFSAMGHCATRAGLVMATIGGKEQMLAQQGVTMDHSLSTTLKEAARGKNYPADSPEIMPWGIYVPIRHGGEHIGLLALDRKLTGRPYSKEEINFLGAMAENAAIAIANARYCEELQETLERERRSYLEKEKMRRYLSAGAVAAVEAGDREATELGGRMTFATILFADVRGFTTLAERVPPEAVVRLLNAYMSRMAGIIDEFGGSLDKFIGDGIMAFFEPQDEIDNEAYRAVACAQAMRRELGKMNEEGAFPDQYQVQIGIGINSGEVVAGNIGSKHRMDYTLIGDNVNLAARLESNAKSGQILVSAATVKRLGGLVPTAYLDTIIVKGKSEPVEVYQVPG